MVKEQIVEYPVYELDILTNQTQTIKLKISDSNGMYIIHRSLVKQMTNNRQGSAHSKTRSEVRGGGRKPWKQKGTGKARAGSIRSPLWRGGGVIFGPRTQNYSQKMNTKERKLALQTLLFNKQASTLIIPESELQLSNPKTKLISQKISNLGLKNSKKILVVVEKKNVNLYLALRNLQNIELIQANQINIVSLLKADNIILTKEGLLTIKVTYNA
uniref:Large ribosomal subunit protein uL4c n=1 Tax=Acrochaetium secundatum TaxID=209631 RepID=A0A4D6BKX4_9FLOR|nr:ribosomal protein L4 [Acrochaetium secundatum]QBX88420.1 ribosomal protein L4 [Acrochaetium secundatum]